MRRLLALVVAVVVAAAAVTVVTRYGTEIDSVFTKRKGAPAHTTAFVPFTPGDAPVVRMAVAGDVGESGARLGRTGAAMAKAEGDDPYDLMLLLGDNVYPAGEPSRVKATVFEPFAGVLRSDTALWAVLGNHDVRHGHGDAELAALGMRNRWWSVERDGLFLIGLDSTQPKNPEQHRWLARTLASPRAQAARWRVVALHHPPYSAGYHGSEAAVRRAFSPLFARYHVQLVLSGHDHDYQRSKPIDGVTYVVSGAGSETRRTGEASFTAVSFSWHHFLDVAVYGDHMTVRAVSQSLRVADEFTLR